MAKRFVVVNLEYFNEKWSPVLRLLYYEICRLAAYKEVEVNGVVLREGQLIISFKNLASLVGVSKSYASKALALLVKIGAVRQDTIRTTKGHPFATVVTVNYAKSSLRQQVENKIENEVENKVGDEAGDEAGINNVLINNNLIDYNKQTGNKVGDEVEDEVGNKNPCNYLIFNNLQPYNNINNNIIVDNVRARGQKKRNNTKEQSQTPSSETNAPKKELKAPKTDDCCFDTVIALSEFENVIKTALETNPRFGLLIHKAGVKPSQAPKFIDEFIALCDIKGEKHRGDRDVLLHFVNYLRKKAEAIGRKDVQNEVDRQKILRHGNYQQQEKARFEEVQRELIGDMLGESRHSGDLPRTGTAYSQSACVGEDDGDVLELPEIK